MINVRQERLVTASVVSVLATVEKMLSVKSTIIHQFVIALRVTLEILKDFAKNVRS